jgi:RimJ/RimL family protein N-acetyltransferase
LVERINAEFEQEGWGPWAVEVIEGPAFVGMCGLHRVNPVHPCAPAVEVAWRFDPAHWGNGYATEAAAAALRHGFEAGGLREIVAFTTTMNIRSQSVMERIGMWRDHEADFEHTNVPVGSPHRPHVLYRVRHQGLKTAEGG